MATTYDFEIDAAMAALDTESLYGLQPEFEDLDTINQAFVIKTSTKKAARDTSYTWLATTLEQGFVDAPTRAFKSTPTTSTVYKDAATSFKTHAADANIATLAFDAWPSLQEGAADEKEMSFETPRKQQQQQQQQQKKKKKTQKKAFASVGEFNDGFGLLFQATTMAVSTPAKQKQKKVDFLQLRRPLAPGYKSPKNSSSGGGGSSTAGKRTRKVKKFMVHASPSPSSSPTIVAAVLANVASAALDV
eukprot:gene4416-26608_t